jgi:hypothetical protein
MPARTSNAAAVESRLRGLRFDIDSKRFGNLALHVAVRHAGGGGSRDDEDVHLRKVPVVTAKEFANQPFYSISGHGIPGALARRDSDSPPDPVTRAGKDDK